MGKVPNKKLEESTSRSNNFANESGAGEAPSNKKNDEGTSEDLFETAGSSVTNITLESPSKKKLILHKKPITSPGRNFYYNKQLLSFVYTCSACDLSFDRVEVICQHFLKKCLPLKKITRMHCICGLEFDMHNYEYHRQVHRESNVLKQVVITINDNEHNETINVEGMARKFRKAKFKITPTCDNPIPEGRTLPEILRNVVYSCKCRLCFERLKQLCDHLNKCDTNEKITRVLCMCGLEFDMQNYDHHCEVHKTFAMIHVKKVTIKNDNLIQISGMKAEFPENENTDKSTKDAEVQTVHLNEPFVETPVTESSFKGNEILEQLLGPKKFSAVIDTIESGIDGKENQTKITIIIEKESEKTVEDPNQANTDCRYSKVAEILKSKTITDQKAADNEPNGITASIEGDNKAADSQEASDIPPNESTAPAKTQSKILISDPADGDANEISAQIEQLVINDIRQHSDTTTNESLAVTPTNPANVAIDSPESTDIRLLGNTALIDGYNKVDNNPENSVILTNGTSAVTPTNPASTAIDGPDSTDIGLNTDTTQIDGYNQTQEESNILTNDNTAPTEPENEAIDDDDPESLEDLKVDDITTKQDNGDRQGDS